MLWAALCNYFPLEEHKPCQISSRQKDRDASQWHTKARSWLVRLEDNFASDSSGREIQQILSCQCGRQTSFPSSPSMPAQDKGILLTCSSLSYTKVISVSNWNLSLISISWSLCEWKEPAIPWPALRHTNYLAQGLNAQKSKPSISKLGTYTVRRQVPSIQAYHTHGQS